MTATRCHVAIVGAGPYGLSAAAHLRAANVDLRVFGATMEFWDRQMPRGMLLRSYWEGSHLSDPDGALTLDAYQRACGCTVARPIPLADFVGYGRWFQRMAVPGVDERRVARIGAADHQFRMTLEDGETVTAARVVVAVGLAACAWRPPLFHAVPRELVSHTSEHSNLARFAGCRVMVVGRGQSALESAALLHEAGADVEVLVRGRAVRWLRHGTLLHTWLHADGNPLGKLLYPPSDIGPPGLNWVVDTPALFRPLPRQLQAWIDRRTTRPAGAGWLRPRMLDVRITTHRRIDAVASTGSQLRLTLDDRTERRADHVLLATGYCVDLSRYDFVSPELLRSVATVRGYPRLTGGFESSIPGLHFLGAAAGGSFGPLMRFVAGTQYAATALAANIVRRDTISRGSRAAMLARTAACDRS